jgi:predicted dehydrogenase
MHPPSPTSDPQQLHLAILGTGQVARNNYLPYLSKQTGITLSYWNRDHAKAKACADQFGGTAHATIADLMAGTPDAVLILTSEKARYELSLQAIAHKPPRIFFEKPLVAQHGQEQVSEDDFLRGREVLQAAHAAGCETAMVFNYRFFDQITTAHRLIAERNLGKAVAATVFVHPACWSHCLDLVTLFLGPAVQVAALAAPAKNAGHAPALSVSVVTASGATAAIQRSPGCDLFHPAYDITIGFEHGRLLLRGLDGEIELVHYRDSVVERIQPGRNDSQWKHYDRSFERSLAAWISSIRNGAPPPVPGRAGLEELRVEAGIARSLRTGAAVDLDAEFPLGSGAAIPPTAAHAAAAAKS